MIVIVLGIVMMAAPDVKKLLELDLETRLALVQQLRDSIVEGCEPL